MDFHSKYTIWSCVCVSVLNLRERIDYQINTIIIIIILSAANRYCIEFPIEWREATDGNHTMAALTSTWTSQLLSLLRLLSQNTVIVSVR